MMVAFLISLAASVQDIRTRSIANAASLALALLGAGWRCMHAPQTLVYYTGFSVAICLLMVVGELLFRRVSGRMAIGMGDIKFIAAWSLWLGPAVIFGVGIGCAFAAFYGVIAKQKTIALVPWLTAGFVLTGVVCRFM